MIDRHLQLSWISVVQASVHSKLLEADFPQDRFHCVQLLSSFMHCNASGWQNPSTDLQNGMVFGWREVGFGFLFPSLPWCQFASCRFSCEIYPSSTKLAQVYFCMVTELLGDSLYDFLKWNGYRGYWLQEILFFLQNRKSIFCPIVLIIRGKTDGFRIAWFDYDWTVNFPYKLIARFISCVLVVSSEVFEFAERIVTIRSTFNWSLSFWIEVIWQHQLFQQR